MAGIRVGQETMLSSKENVVFCNVFLSKTSAKTLSKSFWQTKLKKKAQDIILSIYSVEASFPSLLLNLKGRRAFLTHNSVFSALNNTSQKDKPVLTPAGISLPSAQPVSPGVCPS